MRFKLKTGSGSVGSFTNSDGKIYVPGDHVDLPATYKGEAWLESLDVEPAKTVEPSKPVLPEIPKVTEFKVGVEPEHTSVKPEKPHK
jgi:hypothetical protein